MTTVVILVEICQHRCRQLSIEYFTYITILKHLLKEFKYTLLSAIGPGDRFRFVVSMRLLW